MNNLFKNIKKIENILKEVIAFSTQDNNEISFIIQYKLQSKNYPFIFDVFVNKKQLKNYFLQISFREKEKEIFDSISTENLFSYSLINSNTKKPIFSVMGYPWEIEKYIATNYSKLS